MTTFAETVTGLAGLLNERVRTAHRPQRQFAEYLATPFYELSVSLRAMTSKLRKGGAPAAESRAVDAWLKETVAEVCQRKLLSDEDALVMQRMLEHLRFESGTVFALVAQNPLLLVDEGANSATSHARVYEIRRVRWLPAGERERRESAQAAAIERELGKLDEAAALFGLAARSFGVAA